MEVGEHERPGQGHALAPKTLPGGMNPLPKKKKKYPAKKRLKKKPQIHPSVNLQLLLPCFPAPLPPPPIKKKIKADLETPRRPQRLSMSAVTCSGTDNHFLPLSTESEKGQGGTWVLGGLGVALPPARDRQQPRRVLGEAGSPLGLGSQLEG